MMTVIFKIVIVVSVVARVWAQECFNDKTTGTCMTAPQNAAYRQGRTTASATSTCGSPPSRYCRVDPKNSCRICNASSPPTVYGEKSSHNEAYMIDLIGKTTWWQSETWWDWYRTNQKDPLQVNVTISFNKSFDIMGEIRIYFDSPRPYAMILEKSKDKGKSWIILQFYADNCQDRFNMSSNTTYKGMDLNQVICTEEYSSSRPQQNGEVVYDFSKRYAEETFWEEEVQDYVWATDIRIRMLYPGVNGQEPLRRENVLNKFYYAISDVKIMSRCKCNGHAQYCDYPNDFGKNCYCYHNTAGDDCERCKPLYNNKPWKAASSKSQPNPCEKCECHNHASICEYNQTLRHGVCLSCQHNTTGNFCEQCKDKFYRNAQVTIKDPDTCLSCNCFHDGITNNGSCNNATGQCECRQNVTGRQCDRCKDTFWGPIADCKQCLCYPPGTINGNLSCEQKHGQCQCKPNIHQRQCNTCKDDFFDLPTEVGTNIDCKQCDCNYGGTIQEICDKINGTCLCRRYITGNQCTEVDQGYFVGFLTLLKYEAEYAIGSGVQTSYIAGFESDFTGRGYSKLNNRQWVAFHVKIPATFLFHVVLRYTKLHTSNGSIQVHAMAARTENCTAVNTTHILTPVTNGKGLAWRIKNATMMCKDQEFTFNVTYFSENSNSSVELDSIILIPDITQTRSYTKSQQQPNKTGYYVSTMEECATNYSTVMGAWNSLVICQNISFSVMAQVFDGALACKCNDTGTVNGSVCNPYGGQCHCKPGVTGRTCDQCKPGYFGYSLDGCKPCNCSDKGSQHLLCDVNTGQCPCNSGVITRTCSRCRDNFYGFFTGKGCVECNCNISGSADLQCDDVSGKCPCKNSTAGDKCDRCNQNFFNFTSNGCQACNCHRGGSRSLQCHSDTGMCSCKNNTVGMKCSSCVNGTYNIDVNNPDGCTPCYCYGRSNMCSSARNFTRSNFTSIPNPINRKWNFAKFPNNDSVITFRYENGFQTKYNAGNDNVTIVFAAPTDPEFKNMLLSYGQQLILDIEHKTYHEISWKIELEPVSGSKVFFHVIPSPSRAVTKYSVRLHEDFATEPMSAYDFQSKLANVKRLRVIVKANGQGEFSFKSLSLETVISSSDGLHSVGNVENCTCPANYTGLSCELCNSGYRRLDSSRLEPSNKFVECVLCSCTGRSQECDPESGICKNCRLGSEGDHCERCQPNVDNETDCTQCYPGFYGLGMPNFNGCEDCDCVLGNTPYDNGSVCNMTNGQCTCKPKITGRRCDRCHENAINTTHGCVDCPECYRLLQSEVEILRREITSLQTTMERLKNGHIGDFTFAQQLNNSIGQIGFLVKKADNSSGVERGLYEQLMAMNQTLYDLENALKDTMENGMNALESETRAIRTHNNRTGEVINLVNRVIWQSYKILNSSVKTGLVEIEELTSFLSGNVNVIGIMANQSFSHAREQNRSANIIISRVEASKRLVNDSVQLSVDAAQSHNHTLVMIEELKKNTSQVRSFGEQLRHFVNQLYNNATMILSRTSEVLMEVRALNPDNSHAVTQLLMATKSASDNATLLTLRTEALTQQYANLTSEINRCSALVQRMMKSVNKTEDSAKDTLRKATSARSEATAAITLAEKTHSDAKEMLQILKEFVNQSRQAQDLAQQALTGVSDANKTSTEAIARAQEVHSTIQKAVEYASQSLSWAKKARDLSNSEHQNISAIHTDAKNLESRASNSKYKESYLVNIKQNTTLKHSSAQHLTDSCKLNYSRNAQDAQSSAAEAQSKSDQSEKSAKASRQTVDNLLEDISNLQTVNTTRLKEIQREILRLRTTFTSLDVKHLNAELKVAGVEQAKYISEYRQKVQQIKSETQELRQLYNSLQSVPPCK